MKEEIHQACRFSPLMGIVLSSPFLPEIVIKKSGGGRGTKKLFEQVSDRIREMFVLFLKIAVLQKALLYKVS